MPSLHPPGRKTPLPLPPAAGRRQHLLHFVQHILYCIPQLARPSMDGAVGKPLGTPLHSHFSGQETEAQREPLSCRMEERGCAGMWGRDFPSQLCEQEHSLRPGSQSVSHFPGNGDSNTQLIGFLRGWQPALSQVTQALVGRLVSLVTCLALPSSTAPLLSRTFIYKYSRLWSDSPLRLSRTWCVPGSERERSISTHGASA